MPAVLAEALRTNLTLTLNERMSVDMEWYEELVVARSTFESAQQSARETQAAIKRETGG